MTGGTVYGVLLNHRAQLASLGEALHQKPYGAPPRAPVLYIKPPNTLCRPGERVKLPPAADRFDAAASVAAVIGTSATRVAARDALDHVQFLTLALDLTLPIKDLYRPSVRERSQDRSLTLGATMVPVGDAGAILVETIVDGTLRSRASTADLVRPLAQLIEAVSAFMTLAAGDVLLFGPDPAPVPVVAGSRVRVVASGLDELACEIAA